MCSLSVIWLTVWENVLDEMRIFQGVGQVCPTDKPSIYGEDYINKIKEGTIQNLSILKSSLIDKTC